MEIKKENINLTERIVKLNSNVMVEGDIIVPDIKPDIREILLADANVVTQSSEYRGGKLYVSGNVFFKILYRPDSEGEGCELKSLDASFEFSDSVDIPSGEDLTFFVCASTEHIGFTLVNSRKLSMKVIAALGINGYRERSFAPVTSVTGDDVQCREKRFNIYMPVADEQSDITVSDFLTVPADMPDIDEILKVDAWASGGDCKIMNGKVMVKGTLHLKTLYTAAQDGYTTELVCHEIPFTEIVEAEGVDENCAAGVIFSVKDVLASAKGDINGDTKIISAEILVNARVKASKTVQETICDDCYAIHGAMETETEKMELLEYVASENTEFTETQSVEMPKNVKMKNVINVTAKPILRETCVEDGALHMRGTLVSFLLYREEKEDGQIKCAVTETDFDWQKNVPGQGLIADCDLWVEDIAATKLSADEAEVKATMGLNAKVLKKSEIDIITGCTAVETDEAEENRPSLVIYFTEDGDTLWDVAKKYGTTVEKIQSANGIETDRFSSGKKILIPRAC